jgi:hypothetical protein
MSQHYSNPERESDPHALPDVEIFELTAEEVAERDADMILHYITKRPEFRFASFNSRDHTRMIETMIAENEIEGGWFYWSCFPGCLPDGAPVGPFKSQPEALADARSFYTGD